MLLCRREVLFYCGTLTHFANVDLGINQATKSWLVAVIPFLNKVCLSNVQDDDKPFEDTFNLLFFEIFIPGN